MGGGRRARFGAALLGLTLLVFALYRTAPSGSCGSYVGALRAPAEQSFCTRMLHLDAPLPVQYVVWMSRYARGDFGSTNLGHDVRRDLISAIPSTALLLAMTVVLWFTVSRVASQPGRASYLTALIARSTPALGMSMLLVQVLAFDLHWLPSGNAQSVSVPPVGSHVWIRSWMTEPALLLGDMLSHFALPVLTLWWLTAGGQASFAWVTGRRRNGAGFATALPALLSGDLIVESIYRWNGLGGLFANSLSSEDVGEALTVLLAVGVVCLAALAFLAPESDGEARPMLAASLDRRRLVLVLAVCAVMTIGLALFAEELVPRGWLTVNPAAGSLSPRLAHPSSEGLRDVLGTDPAGRSLLAWVALGGRMSLGVGLGAALIALVVGALATATNNRTVSAAVDAARLLARALPALMLVSAVSVLWVGGRAWAYAALLGVAALAGPRLTLRGAKSAGSNRLLQLTLCTRSALLVAGAVDFLGFGVQSPAPSWGRALLGSTDYLASGSWWWVLFPTLWLGLAVLMCSAVAQLCWKESVTKGPEGRSG